MPAGAGADEGRSVAVSLGVQLYTWCLPELVLTEAAFATACVDHVRALLVPGKCEFVEPRQTTREYYARHTYFSVLETIAEVDACFQVLWPAPP